MNIIFIGAPGAGKGTQASKIVEKYSVVHISTGDIFRKAIKEGTPAGKEAKEYIDAGKLVPDEVTIEIVKERLTQNDCQEGFLLDGFPRTINQAKALDRLLANMDKKIDIVISLEVDFSVLMERLANRYVCKVCNASYHSKFKPSKIAGVCDVCHGELYQRTDDNEAKVKQRLDVYTQETKPLIEYYASVNKLEQINGLQSINDVFNDIVNVIEG